MDTTLYACRDVAAPSRGAGGAFSKIGIRVAFLGHGAIASGSHTYDTRHATGGRLVTPEALLLERVRLVGEDKRGAVAAHQVLSLV